MFNYFKNEGYMPVHYTLKNNYQLSAVYTGDTDTEGNLIFKYAIWDSKGRQVDAGIVRKPENASWHYIRDIFEERYC